MSNVWTFVLRLLRLSRVFRLLEIRIIARSEVGDFLEAVIAGFRGFTVFIFPGFLIAYAMAVLARIFLGGCDREELGLAPDNDFFPCREFRGQGEFNVHFGSVGFAMWTVGLCGFGACYTDRGLPLEQQFFETWPDSQRVFARFFWLLMLAAWNFWFTNVIVSTIIQITTHVLQASPRARQRNRRLKEETQERLLMNLLEQFVDDNNEVPLRMSLTELPHMMSQEGVKEQLEELGWPVSSHFALQQYLGRRGDNEVSLGELLGVLTDMQGTATTIDIQVLHEEFKNVAKLLKEHLS